MLAWLAGISAIFMAGFTVLESADYFPHLAAAKSDHAALVAYDSDKEASIWGIREYIPNYETQATAADLDKLEGIIALAEVDQEGRPYEDEGP